MGRFLLIIIIGYDYHHWTLLRQSRSTHKYEKSLIKSTLDVRSQLTIADPQILSSSIRNGSWTYGSSRTGHPLVKSTCEQPVSTNQRRSIGSPTASFVQIQDSSFSWDFFLFQSVSEGQRARNRCDIEIFRGIRRKVQKNECAIGGRTGTFCKDRARYALLSDW